MPGTNKHILLIAYVFPPYHGIGGRRWARHAEYLAKKGFIIHVICAKNPFEKISLWYNNINSNPNIILYKLPARFPKVMVNFKHNFIQKIVYKFWNLVMPFCTKGNYLDRSVFWKNVLLKKAGKIITEHQIESVICTGGPFSVLYYATLLKQQFPKLFLLSDWRDPWTWAPHWGYGSLSEDRMKVEKHMEKCALEGADIVTVPTESMVQSITSMYPEYKNKIKLLPHFFDMEEIAILPKSKSNKIRMVYYGTVYINTNSCFEELSKFLAEHENQFQLDFYSENPSCKAIFTKNNCKNVNFLDVIPAKKLFARFSDYDFVLLVHPEYGKDNVSTKFYEIIYSQTPIILISKTGLASAFILQNKLGFHAEPGTIGILLNEIYLLKDQWGYHSSFDVSPYSLSTIADKIAKMLNA